MQKTSVKFFLLLSFIEGSAVMATELLGAKMLAPFFGSSLYVWSSVMAITLGGLAAGYFAGGVFSTRNNPEKTLYKIMIGAAVFTVLLPFTSSMSLQLFGYFSLLPAVTINAILILFPPVFLMGMVSPMIIRNIASDANDAGKSAGTVYAISTVGGILATFAFGFYIIPHFGLVYPAVLSGLILGVLPLIQLVKKKE
jgi:predicted membrane-bound spermidine synthase